MTMSQIDTIGESTPTSVVIMKSEPETSEYKEEFGHEYDLHLLALAERIKMKISEFKGDDGGGPGDEGANEGTNGGPSSNNNENSNETPDTNADENSSSKLMLGLLDEFTKIYKDKLERLESSALKMDEKEYLQRKVEVLESWLGELSEQNSVLVCTVGELEQEAASRVSILQDSLNRMVVTTRSNCLSLRDHQQKIQTVVQERVAAQDECDALTIRLRALTDTTQHLRTENANLHTDIDSLLDVLTRARASGVWQCDDVTFHCISPEQVFGPVLPHSSRVSSPSVRSGGLLPSPPCSLPDYHHRESERGSSVTQVMLGGGGESMAEDPFYSSSNGGSPYGREFRHLRPNVALLQHKDKLIAQLQEELAAAQREVQQLRSNNVIIPNSITAVNRLSWSKASTDMADSVLSTESDATSSSIQAEQQLAANIDVLANRLSEAETEADVARSEAEALRQECLKLRQRLNEVNHERQAAENQLQRQQLSIGVSSRRDVSTSTAPLAEEEAWSRWQTNSQLTRLQDEISEKGILVRELQSHLALSRHECQLKDDTLSKVESKLDSVRSDLADREDRLEYLQCQLRTLQLELGRTHAKTEDLSQQVTSKADLVRKLERENWSLAGQLNAKSAGADHLQQTADHVAGELLNRDREVMEQRVTITSLQEALVTSKQTCDLLKAQLNQDYVDTRQEINFLRQNNASLLSQLEEQLKRPVFDVHSRVTLGSTAEGRLLLEEQRRGGARLQQAGKAGGGSRGGGGVLKGLTRDEVDECEEGHLVKLPPGRNALPCTADSLPAEEASVLCSILTKNKRSKSLESNIHDTGSRKKYIGQLEQETTLFDSCSKSLFEKSMNKSVRSRDSMLLLASNNERNNNNNCNGDVKRCTPNCSEGAKREQNTRKCKVTSKMDLQSLKDYISEDTDGRVNQDRLVAHQQVLHLLKECNTLEEQIQVLMEENALLRSSSNSEELTLWQGRCRRAQEELHEALEEVQEKQMKQKETQEALEGALKESTSWKEKYKKADDNLTQVRQEVKLWEGKFNAAQRALEECEKMIEALRENHSQVKDELDQVKDDKDMLEHKLEGCSAMVIGSLEQNAEHRETEEQLQRQLRQAMIRLKEAMEERGRLAAGVMALVGGMKSWIFEVKEDLQLWNSPTTDVLLLNTEKRLLTERNLALQRSNINLRGMLSKYRGIDGIKTSVGSTELLEDQDTRAGQCDVELPTVEDISCSSIDSVGIEDKQSETLNEVNATDDQEKQQELNSKMENILESDDRTDTSKNGDRMEPSTPRSNVGVSDQNKVHDGRTCKSIEVSHRPIKTAVQYLQELEKLMKSADDLFHSSRKVLCDKALDSAPRLRCSRSLLTLNDAVDVPPPTRISPSSWPSSPDSKDIAASRSSPRLKSDKLLECFLSPNMAQSKKVQNVESVCHSCRMKNMAVSELSQGCDELAYSLDRSDRQGDYLDNELPYGNKSVSSIARELMEIREIIENNATIVTSIRGLTEAKSFETNWKPVDVTGGDKYGEKDCKNLIVPEMDKLTDKMVGREVTNDLNEMTASEGNEAEVPHKAKNVATKMKKSGRKSRRISKNSLTTLL